MNEEERVRKLALLPKWEELRNQYEAMVLQRKNDELKAEREDLWLQFPEESLLRMIRDLERKIKEFLGEYKQEAQNTEGGNLSPMAAEYREEALAKSKEQNTDKKQSWGPYQ